MRSINFLSTDIETWRGISGILDGKNGMFLVSVFLADGAPTLPAPPRLDFTAKERFETLAPLIGQTFLIGDGSNRRSEVPASGTRLYLRFADAYDGVFWHGQPGYYSNNGGHLEVVASGCSTGPAWRSTRRRLSCLVPRTSGSRRRAERSVHAPTSSFGRSTGSCPSLAPGVRAVPSISGGRRSAAPPLTRVPTRARRRSPSPSSVLAGERTASRSA